MTLRFPKKIYIVLAIGTERVKIGSTENVRKRIKSLQTGCPSKLILLGTIDGSEAQEKHIHFTLSHKRLHGEWFPLCEEIEELVQIFSKRSMEGLLKWHQKWRLDKAQPESYPKCRVKIAP